MNKFYLHNPIVCQFKVKYEDRDKAKHDGLIWQPDLKLWGKKVEYFHDDDTFLMMVPRGYEIDHFFSCYVSEEKVQQLEAKARKLPRVL